MQPDPKKEQQEEERLYQNTTITGIPNTATTTTNEQKPQELEQQQLRSSLLQQLLSPPRDEGSGNRNRNGSEEEAEEDDDEFGRIVMEDTKRILSVELGEDTNAITSSSNTNKPDTIAGGSNTDAAPTVSTSQPVANETPKAGEEQQISQQPTSDDQVEPKKKVKRKRKPPLVPWKKPADMPRRPLSAYNLYFKQRREELMKEEEERQHLAELAESGTGVQTHRSRRRKKSNRSVGIGFANLAKTIASEWKELSDGSKAPYEEAALPEKQRYDAAMKIWRAKQKEEKAKAAAAAAESKEANKAIAPSSSGSSSSSPRKRPSSRGSSRNSPATMDIDRVDQQEMSTSTQSYQAYEEQHPYSRRSEPQTAEALTSNMIGGQMAASMMSFPMHRQQHQQHHHQHQQHHHQHQYLSTMQSGMQVPSPILQRQFQLQQQQERRQSGLMFGSSGIDEGAAFMHGHFMSPQQQQQHQQQEQSSLDYRMQMLAHHQNSRMAAMLGMTADEYQQHAHSAPTMMDGQGMSNADTQRHFHQEASLPYSASLERRNTWSGLSSAQQQLFFSTQQAPKDRTNSSSYSETASSQQNASSSVAREGSLSLISRERVYPEDWFQADSNTNSMDLVMEGNRVDVETKSVSDTLKGDMNQKMPAPFGSLQTSSISLKKEMLLDGEEATKKNFHDQQQKVLKDIDMHRGQKKQSPPTHSSQIEPLSLEVSSSQQASLRTLGMQLDEESVNFLSNLRFGNSSDHSGNSSNDSK